MRYRGLLFSKKIHTVPYREKTSCGTVPVPDYLHSGTVLAGTVPSAALMMIVNFRDFRPFRNFRDIVVFVQLMVLYIRPVDELSEGKGLHV